MAHKKPKPKQREPERRGRLTEDEIIQIAASGWVMSDPYPTPDK